MCGIAGLYSLEPQINRQNLHKIATGMTDALIHRGPDSGDVWQDPDAPLVFGHRRLAILDLSPAGHQPMQSATGRYVIVFNGEIYNFQKIKTAILHAAPDTKFRGTSDTEIILAAIELWGVQDTIERLNGMFAIALWDRRAGILSFARDRFGKKPLYIGWAGSMLVFGSELKSLCAHPEFRRDVNRNALSSYMRFRYVPAPLCIYKQVWQIPAGCMIGIQTSLLRGGQDLLPMIAPYWSHKSALTAAKKSAAQNPITLNDDAIISEFENLLEQCVHDRMIADVPLGAFLSGGIDSSLVTAIMQKRSLKPIKTYTIGFRESAYDEAAHAQKIAAHLGTDHHALTLESKTALDVIEKLPTIYDEPFADASAIPMYLVSHFARQSVTVALSGDGGDEMLGGYTRHIAGESAWEIVQTLPKSMRKFIAQSIHAIPPQLWNRLKPSQAQFGSSMHKFAHIITKESQADIYLSLVSEWQKPKSLVLDGHEEMIALVDPAQQIEGLSFPENMMYWDTLSYLSGDILTKVDRASMATSLEARAPLLDTRIYDYVWRLPQHCKIRDGKGKWLLREVLKKHVPEEIFNRPKQGFGVPIAQWLREDLKDWAEDLLDTRILRDQGYFNYHTVREMWAEHQKGRGNHAGKLWCVLMFQDWHRTWMDES